MRTWSILVLLAAIFVSIQSMYTQWGGQAAQAGGSPFNLYMQQLQLQRMYQQQQQQYNPGSYNIPTWAFFMDGFDFGF